MVPAGPAPEGGAELPPRDLGARRPRRRSGRAAVARRCPPAPLRPVAGCGCGPGLCGSGSFRGEPGAAAAMSRKQAAKSRPSSGGRRAEAERKRDERAARRALAKERRNRPEPGGSGCEEEFVSFANQLQALGLKLREVPGDG